MNKLEGLITSVSRQGFSIKISSGKIIYCSCTYSGPYREGDLITCSVQVDGPSYRVSKPPLVLVPEDKASIIKGITQALRIKQDTAADVYDELASQGDVCSQLNLLVESRGATVNGLKPIQVSKLKTYWKNEYVLRRLYLIGLTNDEVKETGIPLTQLFTECTTKPFTVLSLPLDKCIQLCQRVGLEYSNDDYKCAEIARHLYKDVTVRGWTCTPTSFLIKQFPNCSTLIPLLKAQYNVVTELHSVYLPEQHQVETNVSAILCSLIKRDILTNTPVLSQDITLTDEQSNALLLALNAGLSIITGSAGSGKTTLIAEIARNVDSLGKTCLLCSFTGKAVARLHQATGRSCATINRFLTYCAKVGEADILEALDVPRYPDYIIVDESSMVTTDLLYSLLECVKQDSTYPQVVLVGDINQLPPIGWGSLFRDLLATKLVPTVYLTVNQRVYTVEGEENGILSNANAVLNGLDIVETANFTVTPDESIEAVIKAFSEAGQRLDIVTPYVKHLKQLNLLCQKYNSRGEGVVDGFGVRFRIGDRVMMKSNNYRIGLMNGEDGVITNVGKEGITVEFPNLQKSEIFPLAQPRSQASQTDPSHFDDETKEVNTGVLEHSFAITIHKSQGSEYDFVAFYLPDEEASKKSRFLNKHLIYTALTRSKRAFYLVGDLELFQRACSNTIAERISKLTLRMTNGMN